VPFDSELLAEVYVELIGGRQARLVLGEESDMPALAIAAHRPSVSERPVPRFFRVTADELTVHRARIGGLGDKAIWFSYFAKAGIREATAG